MKSFYLATTHPNQRKAFAGHHPRQAISGANQHDRLTHPFLVKKINIPWYLIGLGITFSIGRINYLLASWWGSRSGRENMAEDGCGHG
jgi:hypothetical protein